jgi:hypothetical protein
MRYRLRSLLLLMTLAGPIAGWSVIAYQHWRASQRPTCGPGLKQISIALHNYHNNTYRGPKVKP